MTANNIKEQEAQRLSAIGIPYRQIMVLEEGTVIIVDEDTLESIIRKTEDGEAIYGRFIAESDGVWAGFYVDEYGDCCYRTGLTERTVYRFVLGYEVGRRPQESRFKGYCPIKKRRKNN